jgi:hypothetical protein
VLIGSARHIASGGNEKYILKFDRKPQERGHLLVNERIILKWISEIEGAKVCTGFN